MFDLSPKRDSGRKRTERRQKNSTTLTKLVPAAEEISPPRIGKTGREMNLAMLNRQKNISMLVAKVKVERKPKILAIEAD